MSLHIRKTWHGWFAWFFSLPVSTLMFDDFGNGFAFILVAFGIKKGFGIDLCIDVGPLLYPKLILKSKLWATHFRPTSQGFATLPFICFHGGFFWIALASLWLMLVPFRYPFASSSFWYPLTTFWQVRWTLLGSLGFHYECFLHLSVFTHLRTERSTDTQPIRITCTLSHSSHRHADHKAGRRNSRSGNNSPILLDGIPNLFV